MKQAPAQRPVTLRLPKLAALMLVFLGLSTNTHLDAATAWQPMAAHPQPQIVPQPKISLENSDDQIHVLSARDAALYRAAFAAQEKTDWKSADEALEQVRDKKLVGHVLADRYLRRDFNLDEVKQWLAAYSDMPEADALYDQAKTLRGFATAHIVPPKMGVTWSGGNGGISSAGFRGANSNDGGVSKNHTGSKINAALHHGDPLKARELLTTELHRGSLSTGEASDIVSHIAASFFYEGEIERARPMAHMAADTGAPLGMWIEGLSAWKQRDFSAAARAFTNLTKAPGLSSWDKAAASYWAYRATTRLGEKAQAVHWLAEAAQAPHSFYGAMAASLIGNNPERSWKMPALNAKNIAVLSGRPAGWQALALVQVGRNDLAESELHRLTPMDSREVQTATLALAEKARMPSLILQLSGVATNDNGKLFEAAQYPLPPWQPTGGFKVDRALIYALMRHESQFDPEAVSQRGACGLMQIMPSTARLISNENKIGRGAANCPDSLFDPTANLDMGQKYVRVLAGQPMIGDNLLLLLAAYNGGPGNLARWLDGDNRADPLLFVESLPIRETRDYVQQVLLQYWMYRSRLSEPETTAAQLARGQWPRYALRDETVRDRTAATQQGLELASLDPAALNGNK
jgi:soluble lytic murein transglycosylase-like protein